MNYDIAEVRKNLKNLLLLGVPFTITRYKEPIAEVRPIKGAVVDKVKEVVTYTTEHKVPERQVEVIKPKEFVGKPAFDNFITQKQIKMCKHGYAVGNCKMGCR